MSQLITFPRTFKPMHTVIKCLIGIHPFLCRGWQKIWFWMQALLCNQLLFYSGETLNVFWRAGRRTHLPLSAPNCMWLQSMISWTNDCNPLRVVGAISGNSLHDSSHPRALGDGQILYITHLICLWGHINTSICDKTWWDVWEYLPFYQLTYHIEGL